MSLTQQQKPTTITSSNQIYQVNLPSTYHHIIPSNSLHSYTPVQAVSTSEANNQLFLTSVTTNGNTNNISSSLLNTIQTTSTHMHLQPSIQQNSSCLNHTNNAININNNSSNMSIISSNSFPNNLVSNSSTLNQPSNGWYYDSLLVDNVDDFLP